jgi:flagellar hook assembly protein FlgD
VRSLPEDSYPSIMIFDQNGNLIRKLGGIKMSVGKHSISWNAKNNDGVAVLSGTYLVKIKLNNREFNQKITLVK